MSAAEAADLVRLRQPHVAEADDAFVAVDHDHRVPVDGGVRSGQPVADLVGRGRSPDPPSARGIE